MELDLTAGAKKTNTPKLDTHTMMRPNVKYTFTVNPPNDEQYFGEICRFRKVYDKVSKRLKGLSHCYFEIYPEVSKRSRIHFHGYIWTDQPADFMIYDLHLIDKKYSFDIDVINDPEVWSSYVTKDRDIMLPYCHKHELKYKLTNKPKHKLNCFQKFMQEDAE